MNSRIQAIQTARELLKLHPVYLDTETTGIDSNSEIVEICIIDDDDHILYQSLVKPSRPIPNDAIRIHGITDELVRDAPNWLRVWPEVEKVLRERVIGIYNAEFDLRMISQTNQRYHIYWNPAVFANKFCLMKLFAQYYGEWDVWRQSYRWQSLEAAGRYLNIPIPNSHRALDDTRLARAVHLAIANLETR